MPDIFPAETDVVWDWTASGGTPFFERSFRGAIAWQWGTSGNAQREILVDAGDVAWQWATTGSAEQLDRQELFIGTGMKLSVYRLAEPDERVAIVQYESLAFEEALSSVTGGEAVIAAKYFDPAWAEEDMVWRIDVEGVERSAFLTQDSEDFRVSKDGQRVVIAGRSLAEVLEWATIAPANFGSAGQTITRRFTAPRASVLHTLFQEAQTRGAIPMVSAESWNGVQGSDGFAWTDVPELEFQAGSTLLDRTDEWADLGFEWHMDSRFRWRVANRFGRDLTGLVRLYPAQSIAEQKITRSFKELRTKLFVQDGNEGVSLIGDPAAVDEFGVREQYVVFGDTVTEGDRTANGYALLNLVKSPVVERIVEIDPYAVGRRPFVDFGLGDEVSVMFDRQPVSFRVLAISMKQDQGKHPRCEVVLEDMIEAARRRRRRLLDANGGGGGVGTGQSTVFAETTSSVTIGTSPVDLCVVRLTSFVSTYGKLGWLLNGTASAAQLLTVEIVYGSTVLKTFYHQVPRAGLDTAEITWLWPAIPSGDASLLLRVRTDTGTFALAQPGDGQLWVEAKGIQGFLAGSADIFVNDDVAGAKTAAVDLYPSIAEGLAWSDLETDYRPELEDIVEVDLYTVVDSVSGPTEVVFGTIPTIAGGADDGYIAGASTFNNSATSAIAGDVGGVSHSAFYRFVIPVDLAGTEIVGAWLSGTANATAAAVASTAIRAVKASNPTTISSFADYGSRTRTTNSRAWDAQPTAGQAVVSADLRVVIQELVDAFGTLDSIVLLQENDGSPTNGRIELRTQEHSPGPKPVLTIQYRVP